MDVGDVCHPPKSIGGVEEGDSCKAGGLLVQGGISHIDRPLHLVSFRDQADILPFRLSCAADALPILETIVQLVSVQKTGDVVCVAVAHNKQGEMLGKFPQGFRHMGVEFSAMTAQVVVFHLAAAGKQLLVPLRGQLGKQSLYRL